MNNSGRPTGKRVLVVDDEPDIVAITRVALQNAGYEVLSADNGLDAVKSVYNESPDCVILDVMMPRMNGYQVCRLLKHDARTKAIPIIFCTVRSLETDRLYGMTSGADHYLTKPFDPADLVRLVGEILRNSPPSSRRQRSMPRLTSPDSILTEINTILDQKLKEYTILQYVSRAIAGTLNLEDLLGIILSSTTTNMGFQRGYFFMIDDQDGLEERLSIDEGADRAPWKGSLRDLPLLRAIVDQGLPRLLGRNEVDGVVPEAIHRGRDTIWVVVPVVAKGRSLGFILIDGGGEGACGEDTLGFFQTLAGQAGLAIENARLYAKTLKLSITDGLTGLYNYRYFMERLEAEFTRAKRYGREMALFILDLDHFKEYNDRHGHLHGDEALRTVACVLRRSIREGDVVARYGGEEFSFIIPETGLSEGLIFADRIRKSVEEACRELGGLSCSVGVAILAESMQSAEDLIRKGDEALYEAKNLGRNRVCG
jgi:diguanylate cyclase (GGDEF)-like protein